MDIISLAVSHFVLIGLLTSGYIDAFQHVGLIVNLGFMVCVIVRCETGLARGLSKQNR